MTTDEYNKRETAIAKLTELEVTEPNATMADAKRVLADMPCAEAVSLHDIYRELLQDIVIIMATVFLQH